MPELPEVETICLGLKKHIIGQKIICVNTSNKNLRLPFPDFSCLVNAQIQSITRKARYLLLQISNEKILLVHLGMSGKLLFKENISEDLDKHDHFIIKFQNGSRLIYNDTRRFGLVDLVDSKKINQHKMIKNLGPEPLSDEFDETYLADQLKDKKINIKTAMMDNSIVVGVGNIYINESLFESGISPLREARSLKKKELKILISNIKKILQKAIELGGSTLRDYVQSNGDVGGFQFDFKVYGRESQPCFTCGEKIKRIRQNGRSSFYCRKCQK